MLAWQVLIASIPHRHEKLLALLAELDKQARPGFGALLYRDNLQQSVPEKRQVLLEAATADYVSFIDDDDMVTGWFVPMALSAISLKPDYVGFMVEYSVDGEFQNRAEHSIRYASWQSWPERYVRDITHLNPIKRELALLGRFDDTDEPGEDSRWSDQIRATGRVLNEEWINELMYRYQFSKKDCHRTKRYPLRPPFPEIPDYPWLELVKSPLEGK